MPVESENNNGQSNDYESKPLAILEYSIDKHNKFSSIEPRAWMDFAMANNTPDLTPHSVRGQLILDYIDGDASREIYNILFKRIRREKRAITFPFRCDSADIRRFMNMEMLPGENDSIKFVSSVLRVEERAPISLLDVATTRTEDIIIICSWCKDIWVYDYGWISIDDGVRRLGIFDAIAQPRLTYSVCSNCQKLLDTKLL